MCPIPLIMLNWSTIRLSIGPPLKTLCGLSCFTEPLTALFPWHMLSAVAAVWHQVQNIPHLLIQSCTPLFPSLSFSKAHLTDPAEGLTCYEHGCSAALAGNKPFPFLEGAALHWCAMQSAWTGWWLHLVPLVFANMNSPYCFRLRASVPTIPWMAMRVLCQNCLCRFVIRKLVALLLNLMPAASELDFCSPTTHYWLDIFSVFQSLH